MEASAAGVNDPHVNDKTEADPDDFFGDDDESHAEEPTAEAEVTGDGSGEALPPVEEPAAEAAAPPAEEPPAQSIPATATAAGRAAAATADAATPPPDPAAGTTEPPAPPAEAPEPEKKKERPYKVFRELKLDEGTLTKLLEHVRGGADPIDVYLEVETVEARNDVHALRQVYASHRQQIGESPRLVPVTERAWKVKKVSPRKRVEEALEIT
jgi:hypothetical protein